VNTNPKSPQGFEKVCTAVSFSQVNFKKGGSFVMSYHETKSTGQRSFGLVFVIVFHIILIYGLASGLAGDLSSKVAEVLETKVVEEDKPPEVELPPPPPPDTKIPPPDFVPPPSFDFVPDAPAATTAIQQIQRDKPTPPVVEANMTKPKPAGKGLSRPPYPATSERLGEEGSVGLQLYINETGRVSEAKMISSSGFERLDEAAVKHATRSWKFVPCMKGDVPVACWHQMKFTFKIEDAKN
jgi:periplasmic protein TonB